MFLKQKFHFYFPFLYCFLTHKSLVFCFIHFFLVSCVALISWYNRKDQLLRKTLLLLLLYQTSAPSSPTSGGICHLLISHFNAFKLFQFPHLKIRAAGFDEHLLQCQCNCSSCFPHSQHLKNLLLRCTHIFGVCFSPLYSFSLVSLILSCLSCWVFLTLLPQLGKVIVNSEPLL